MKLSATNRFGKMVTVWLGAMLILLRANPADVTQASTNHRTLADRTSTVKTEIVIGELVGAEYDFQQNELALYATEPMARRATVLSVDDIIKMAQAGWTVSNFGFSLEHDRLAARFSTQDIVDPAGLASKIRQAEGNVHQYLSQQLSAEAQQFLKKESFSADSLNKLQQVLVGVLNQWLNDKSLYDPQRFTGVELTMETKQLVNRTVTSSDLIRRNRYLLEDAFPQEIAKRLGPYKQIRYLPLETEHLLKPIFQGSSAEATFVYTDKTLKDLAHCEKVADDLRLGPCEMFLITYDLAHKQATGSSPTFGYVGSHVIYFDLETKFKFDYPTVVWYENPKIVVKAADRRAGAAPPKPAQMFANNLTRHMDQLLTHNKLGAEFRRLKALFLLHQTFGWARLIFIPVNQSLLKSYRSIRFKQIEPIRPKVYPVFAFPDPQDPRRLQIFQLSGGIQFSINTQSLFADWQGSHLREISGASEPTDRLSRQPNLLPMTSSQEATMRRPLGLKVEPVVKDGRKLLKINISTLLGL